MTDKRTIAIGDIHGRYDLLKDLLEKIKYNPVKDIIIFLGDYIDRGNQSAEVLQFVISLKKQYKNNVVLLIGNHEQMAYDYLQGTGESWLYNGYEATLQSYEDKYGNTDLFIHDIKFIMQHGKYYHEDKENIFVHAGIQPNKPLNQQNKMCILWEREKYINNPVKAEKTVISGHTPSISVKGDTLPYYTAAGNIVIDTGAVFTGVLTAYIRQGEKKEFVQTHAEK